MKKNSKIVSAAIAFMLVSTSSQFTAEAYSTSQSIAPPTVLLNGEVISFTQAPFIMKGVTMAPGKGLFESLGYVVTYDEENQLLTAVKQELEINLKVGQQFATINDAVKELPVATILVEDEIYVPLRFLAEFDGHNVRWDSAIKTIRMRSISDELLPITLTLPYSQPTEQFFQRADQLSKLIERENRVQLDWEVVTSDHYQDKLNLMIAAGEPLELVYMPNPAIYPADLLASIAIGLDNKLAYYGALSHLPANSLTQLELTTDGLYGVPKLNSSVDGIFPVVNQDWLDALGLAQPKTMEEIYLVMDYFSKNDPDANGKHDTFGLTGYINKADLGSLAWVEWVFNENASRYEQRGDEIVDLALQEGTREALLWLNKAYAEGLIDPEVAVNTAAKAEQMLTEDKAGIVAMTLANAATIDQGNELGAYTPLSSLQAEANSALVTATSPANQGMYFISRFAKNHELNASLEVLNTLYSLAGNSEADPAARVLAVEVVGSSTVQFNNVDEQIKARYSQIEAERSEVSAKVLLEIELYAKLDSSLLALKTKLDRQMTEMKVKVIVGAISIEDWDSYVTKLSKDSDYIAIMDAFNNK